MIDIILVSIISASSALWGVWITHHYESKKRKSEEKRWYADYFLGRKIDELNNLFVALVDCHFIMDFYGNFPPSTLQEFKEKVQPKEDAYLKAKVKASIYFDNKADKIMSNALSAFRQASRAIWLSLPDDQCPANKNAYNSKMKNLNWERFQKTYKKAVSCLKEKLNPKILEYIEIPK